jgi:metal-responsive CopG/Arc/MetJ family transcriptional regulator
MTAIHVSIPVRLLQDFDETIGYAHSRSRKISQLMEHHLSTEGMLIADASTRQLMAALTARSDVDETMKVLLVQLLTSSSSNAAHDA